MANQYYNSFPEMDDVLKDVKDIYDNFKGKRFTLSAYVAEGKYGKTTIRRLGGWNAILLALGIELNVHYTPTKADVAQDVHNIIEEYGSISSSVYRKYGSYSQVTVDKLFGNYTNMMKELGYDAMRPSKIMSDEEMIEVLKEIFNEHGYLNSTLILNYAPFSFVTCLNRFKNMCNIYSKLNIDPNKNKNSFFKRADYFIGAVASILGETPIPEWTNDELLNPEKNNHLYVDAYFQKSNIAIEYDGEQHFKYIPFLHGSDENKFVRQTMLDEHKAFILNSLGIKLIRFRFDEPFDIDFIKERVNKHIKLD